MRMLHLERGHSTFSMMIGPFDDGTLHGDDDLTPLDGMLHLSGDVGLLGDNLTPFDEMSHLLGT
jgi:hypothetical protein